MQTFLVSLNGNFYETAEALDKKRLGKQRLEAMQILNCLRLGPMSWSNPFKKAARCRPWRMDIYTYKQLCVAEQRGYELTKTPYYNHPAVQMWRTWPRLLASYGYIMCTEWQKRGFRDTMGPRFEAFFEYNPQNPHRPPWPGAYTNSTGNLAYMWWCDERLVQSHRSNLIRKFPEHYGPLWPDTPRDLPYFWPTKQGDTSC